MVTLLQIFSCISIMGIVLFFILYLHNPASLINGFVFDCDLGLLLITLIAALSASGLSAAGGILLVILLFIATLIAFGGIWIVIGYLLFNAVQVFKRERHILQNMLSLIIGAGLLAQIILFFTARRLFHQPSFLWAMGLLIVIECWLAVTAVCFITTSWLCRMDRPLSSTNYMIVLGCGLLNGTKVSPLLAGRIDCAIKFYQKARGKNQHPKLVFSGGQGGDETLPEAVAMQEYAIAHGISKEDTLIETKSKNTLENFQFSKALMEADAGGRPYKCAYVTSNYHVLRGRILARKAGLLKAKGMGAHTARYYVTNAMIREYVAIMLQNKKINTIMLSLITLSYVMCMFVITK